MSESPPEASAPESAIPETPPVPETETVLIPLTPAVLALLEAQARALELDVETYVSAVLSAAAVLVNGTAELVRDGRTQTNPR